MTVEEEDEAPDPAEAFEALRKEVAGQGWATRKEVDALRAAVETLQRARGVDYTPTLAALNEGQAAIRERLDVIEARPALDMTPQRYAQEVASAATRVEADQRQRFETMAREQRTTAAVIERIAGQVRDRQLQDRWLCGAFGVGLGVGMVLWAAIALPLLRRFGLLG